MNRTNLIIITIALVTIVGIIFIGQPKNNIGSNTGNEQQKVDMIDGIQYITINAKGGYSPKISVAKANIPTKLIVETNGTYDCSASLVIRSIGYQKVLPQTGKEIIDLGVPEPGKLQGLCSMGMYNFSINFE